MPVITIDLSEDEIQNFKQGLSQLEEDFLSENTYQEFLDDPYSFLNNMRIGVVERIGSNQELIWQFNNDVKKILPSWRIALKDIRCVMCKIGALTILYSLLGSVGVAWDGAIAFIDNTFISAIDKVIGGTGEKANAFMKSIRDFIQKLTITELALQFCRFHGHCKA